MHFSKWTIVLYGMMNVHLKSFKAACHRTNKLTHRKSDPFQPRCDQHIATGHDFITGSSYR